MQQNQQYRAPPREKTIQDYPQLKLTAPKTGTMERNPSMMMYTHANVSNPSNSEVRFVAFTQSPDPLKSKIEIKIGLIDAVTVLKAIQDIAKSTDEKVESVVAQTYRPKDYKNRAAGMMEDVKVVVGKNESGVFISLVHWNSEFPRIRFFFGFDNMFEFVINTDKHQTFSKFSAYRALAHTEVLQALMVKEMTRVWKPWTPPTKDNNGGNYTPKSNSGYPKQSNQDDADLDDIFG